MTRILVHGAKGRMGQAILGCAQELKQFEVVGKIDQGDDARTAISKCDVIIDFSFHSATAGLTQICVSAGKAMVIGTTGHTDDEKKTIEAAAGTIPIVFASNFSTGVNVLFWLTLQAAEALGENFDREIVEMHHRHKKDSPSGTARRLAEILAKAQRAELSKVARYGREGIGTARSHEEIGIHSVRGGDVVGDHTVIFATEGERLELTHKASSRETFASGALRAASWVGHQKPGLYDMQDVLNLK